MPYMTANPPDRTAAASRVALAMSPRGSESEACSALGIPPGAGARCPEAGPVRGVPVAHPASSASAAATHVKRFTCFSHYPAGRCLSHILYTSRRTVGFKAARPVAATLPAPYTSMTMLALLIATAAMAAQFEAPQPGTVYEVYYRDGAAYRTVYGHVREVGMERMEITPDEPWRADARRFYVERRNVVDLKPEPATDRERRHQRGWEETGYELTDTAQGRQPVSRTDVELAARAHGMAEAAAFKDDGPPAPDAAAYVELAPQPGLAAQWWAHAVVAAITATLLIAVAAGLIFR